MDEKLAGEYLRRIGVARPHAADARALRLLHRAHQLAVPFENLASTWPSRSRWRETT